MRATSLARAETQVRSWVLMMTVAPPGPQVVQNVQEAVLGGGVEAVHGFIE